MSSLDLRIGARRVLLQPKRFIKPSGMPTLPIMPTGITAPGLVRTNTNAVAACYAYNSAYITAGTTWVATDGNDTTGDGSEGNPYLTVSKAVRTTLGPTLVNLKAGTYDVSSLLLRNTDTSQGSGPVLKHVRAAPGLSASDVKLNCSGPDLTTQTWTITAGGGGVYSTVLSGTTLPYKVTRSDSQDDYGYNDRLHVYADEDALRTAGTGFYWSNGDRTLYLALGGANVESSKAILKGYYTLSTGLARILVQNAPLLLERVTLDGVVQHLLNQAQVPAVFQTQIWSQDCIEQFQYTVGVNNNGGLFVGMNTRWHAGDSDARLHNTVAQSLPPLFQEINEHITMPGDVDTGNAGTANCNGSSAHVGNGARLGGRYYNCFGPCVRDRADTDSTTYYTWEVGLDCQDADEADGYGHSFTCTGGTSQRRVAHLDTCFSSGQPTGDLQSNASGSGSTCEVYVRGGNLATRSATGAGTISSYSRNRPG